tara:strand:+ start:4260 stop:4589 length:330 start_codon:yes stop_codon:yes gene_type:complete
MKKDVLKVGTLINDNGKMGLISRVIEVGELQPTLAYISWRANYEIQYTDGTKLIVGCRALEQMIENGAVKILSYPTTTDLPPSCSLGIEEHTPDMEGCEDDTTESDDRS